MDGLGDRLLIYGVLVVAVILHEVSHGVVALFFGDDTAKRAGRLTLNPIPHIDPVGSILLPAMMVLAGRPAFGWAKPVPVNASRLRNPRSQMLAVGLAGPLTNFSLMMIAALAVRFIVDPSTGAGLHVGDDLLLELNTLPFILWSFALVNLFLGIFNMLPIPPLDGSSLIERLLPQRHLPIWYKFRPYGFAVIFAAVFLLPVNVFSIIIDPFWDWLADFVFATT